MLVCLDIRCVYREVVRLSSRVLFFSSVFPMRFYKQRCVVVLFFIPLRLYSVRVRALAFEREREKDRYEVTLFLYKKKLLVCFSYSALLCVRNQFVRDRT